MGIPNRYLIENLLKGKNNLDLIVKIAENFVYGGISNKNQIKGFEFTFTFYS